MHGYANVDHVFGVCLLNSEPTPHLRETNCCLVMCVFVARFCNLVCGAV